MSINEPTEHLPDLSARAFVDELSQLSKQLRTAIEAEQQNLDPSPEAIAERRKRVLRGDFRYFCYTYFPHHIWGEPSLFHDHCMNLFPQILAAKSGSKNWWVAPRGEAKSTIITKLGPLFVCALSLLQREDVRQSVGIKETPPFIDYVVLLGAETRLPTKLLAVVKTELESNMALDMDFPEITGRGTNWRITDIVTRTNVRIEPFGAEQAIRGTFHGSSRPKLLLGDDLITDKEAKSPTECDNRWDWLEKAIDYLGPPDGSVKFVCAGTILNRNDPISRAKKTIGHIVHHFRAIVKFPTNKELWETCEQMMLNDDRQAENEAQKAGKVIETEQRPSYKFYIKNKKKMDEGAVVSWPSVRGLYSLMRARRKNKKAFATEMQGDAREGDERTFNNVQFYIALANRWAYYGACDPSMGKNQKSHPSSITVGAWDTEKACLHVVSTDSKKRLPSKLEADLISTQREFNCVAIGFENNVAFEYMRTQFREHGAQKGVPLPLVGVTATLAPELCIDSLEPYICDAFHPQILFNPESLVLLDQLDEWPDKPNGHHYDALISLYILWELASRNSHGIPTILTGKRPDNTLRGYHG